MKTSYLLLLCTILLSLTACETFDGLIDDISSIELPSLEIDNTENPENYLVKGNCPETKVVDELAGFSEFTNVYTPSEDQLISRAHISSIEGSCTYDPRSMTVDVSLGFETASGPQAPANSLNNFSFPFFVAITDPHGNIAAKQVFTADISFNPGENYKSHKETLRQVIPLVDTDEGKDYKILVGFQLSPEQLGYNRMIVQQQKAAEEAAARAKEQAASATAAPQSIVPEPSPDEIIIMRTTGNGQ